MLVQLKSPENTQVISVAVADQATIQAGDLILKLDDSHPQRYLATLKEKEQTLNARLALLSDEEPSKRRDALKDVEKFTKEQLRHNDLHVQDLNRDPMLNILNMVSSCKKLIDFCWLNKAI